MGRLIKIAKVITLTGLAISGAVCAYDANYDRIYRKGREDAEKYSCSRVVVSRDSSGNFISAGLFNSEELNYKSFTRVQENSETREITFQDD